MIPRRIISFIGRRLYQQQYFVLKERLQEVYIKMQSQQLIKNNGMLEMLLISGEDHRFKYRFGFDVIAIIRALKNRVIHNRVEGASTIEQQLVRVLTSDFNKTLKRKIKEIFLSTVLCELVPRKDIPTIYLYVAYYGTGMRGLEQVFKKFGITKSQTISNEMCAEIIARIKYPEPQKRNEKRLRQIEMRKKHLLALYNKHRLYKKFKIYD